MDNKNFISSGEKNLHIFSVSENNNNDVKKSTDGLESAVELDKQTDTKCRYTASCKPDCLQKCATPKVYMCLAFTFMVVQGKINHNMNLICLNIYWNISFQN